MIYWTDFNQTSAVSIQNVPVGQLLSLQYFCFHSRTTQSNYFTLNIDWVGLSNACSSKNK